MTTSSTEGRSASSTRPSARRRRSAGRQQRHAAHAEQAVLQHPRAAAEHGRRGVGVVGALDGVEDVVGHVQAHLHQARGDDGDQRGRRVEEAGPGGDGDPQQDGGEGGGQERRPGGAGRGGRATRRTPGRTAAAGLAAAARPVVAATAAVWGGRRGHTSAPGRTWLSLGHRLRSEELLAISAGGRGPACRRRTGSRRRRLPAAPG